MKIRKKPIWITLISLVLCVSMVVAVTHRSSIVAFAVSQTSDNGYTFDDKDKVHVVGWHGDWDQYNKPWEIPLNTWWNDSVYTYDKTAGRWKTDDYMRWQNGEGLKHHFVAWWPENIIKSNENLTAVDVTVTGDYNKDDILLAHWSGEKPENNQLNMEFEHLLSRFDVHLYFRDEYAGAKDISIETHLKKTAVCNFLKGEVTATSGEGIIMQERPYPDTNWDWSGTCITVPQDFAGPLLTINFTVNGEEKSISYTHSQDLIFHSGERITLMLEVGKDKVTLTRAATSNDFPDGWDMNAEVNLDGTSDIIGTADAGKTQWNEDDIIFTSLNSKEYGLQTARIQYQSGVWVPSAWELSYLKEETPTITALYAPSYYLNGTVMLHNGMQPGMDEYIETNNCTIVDGEIKINWKDVERPYSRLRIVAEPHEQLTVTTTGFTPAGTSDPTPKEYTLTADANGNAYLYGKFENGNMVKVVGKVTVEHRFTATTVAGTSYVLDARPLYVNLGLPSGTLWATYNVGANNPWDYGDYFAWGDTSPKASYTWDNYKWGTQDNLTKYNSTDGKTILEEDDDAATVNMGADWRMPTAENWQELIDNCTWTWTTVNGVNGYTVTGSNGNSIFLPATGAFNISSKVAPYQGLYWANVISDDFKFNAKDFIFDSNQGSVDHTGNPRYVGLTVRAVYDPENS